MTLYILGTDEGRKKAKKNVIIYTFVTIFTLIFSFVYEMFGHGVYSIFMIGAFAFPLIMGVIFWLVMANIKNKFVLSNVFVNAWSATLFTMMFGFIYKGVLDIYGTAAKLTYIYWLISGALFMVAVISVNMKGRGNEKTVSSDELV